MPVALGLVALDGSPVPVTSDRVNADGVFVLDRAADSLTFSQVPSRPVPSLFRGFSAPVRVSLDLSDAELLALLRHDTDPFNRWQSSQAVALRLLTGLATASNTASEAIAGFTSALRAFAEAEASRDPAFTALVLSLPSEAEVAQEIGRDVDPDSVHRAREELRRHAGAKLAACLGGLRGSLASVGPYRPDAASAGRRALRNIALDLMAASDQEAGQRLALDQFEAATNMTDRLAAFATLSLLPGPAREQVIRRFAERYRDEPLVLDKWFALQAAIPETETLARVQALMAHPAFSLGNPNRVRSLIGSFALNNPTQFHRRDGAGYEFVADIVMRVDASNPQLAARLLTAFGSWRTMEPERRAAAERALRRIAGRADLSRDVGDIVQRSLS
jgi:aminopeptidase N